MSLRLTLLVLPGEIRTISGTAGMLSAFLTPGRQREMTLAPLIHHSRFGARLDLSEDMSDSPKNHQLKVNLPFQDIILWQKFVAGIRWENRFHLSGDTNAFLDAVLRYASKYKTAILSSTIPLFRARVHRQGQRDAPFDKADLGAPPRELAGHGRLNPKGIPYLYLASDLPTAASEVRPWSGCVLTVGEFRCVQDLKVIDLRVPSQSKNAGVESDRERAEITWRELISWLFSHPFDPRDDTAYVPTQFITERIKGSGFDGVIYDSALSSTGYNVALFNVESARCIDRRVAKVAAVNLDVKEEHVPESGNSGS